MRKNRLTMLQLLTIAACLMALSCTANRKAVRSIEVSRNTIGEDALVYFRKIDSSANYDCVYDKPTVEATPESDTCRVRVTRRDCYNRPKEGVPGGTTYGGTTEIVLLIDLRRKIVLECSMDNW